MYYYNQNDYPNIPYAYNGNGKTVATSGCGVVTACIVVNNMADRELYSVSKMAKLSLDSGARDSSGTNMAVLLNAICKKNPSFSYTTTTNEDKVVAHLKKGGYAIVNQGDAYNVFSTAGHYVVAYKMSGNDIDIIDPQMYDGKYDAYKRPERIVKKTARGCIVTKTQMGKATSDRNPAYFLVTYKAKAPKIENGNYSITNVRGIYKGAGAKTGRKKVKDLTASGRKSATSKKKSDNAYLKAGTRITILETKLISSGNLWARIPSGWLCIWEKNINKTFVK